MGDPCKPLCSAHMYCCIYGIPNFGGYCHNVDVFFGNLRVDGAFGGLRTKRLVRAMLECRNRCFCDHGLEDRNQQPKAVAITRNTWRAAPGTPGSHNSPRQGSLCLRSTARTTDTAGYLYDADMVEFLLHDGFEHPCGQPNRVRWTFTGFPPTPSVSA